jgi:hypothetical protein
VRRLVPAAAVLALGAHDYDHQPGKPACAWDAPAARQRLVIALVGDPKCQPSPSVPEVANAK